MAHATELTITTGRTHYCGDPDSDERILRREVRVSVTYRMEPGDLDVPLLATVKAAEAERALEAACQIASSKRHEPCPSAAAPAPAANGTAATAPPDQPPSNGQFQHSGNGNHVSGSAPYPNGPALTASHASGLNRPSPTRTASRGKRNAMPTPPVAPAGTSASSLPQGNAITAIPPITTPQRLAIRSLCHRLNVEAPELTLLLDERFSKERLEDLSKEEASALLIALQRGEWEEAARPTFAN